MHFCYTNYEGFEEQLVKLVPKYATLTTDENVNSITWHLNGEMCRNQNPLICDKALLKELNGVLLLKEDSSSLCILVTGPNTKSKAQLYDFRHKKTIVITSMLQSINNLVFYVA